MRVMPLAALTAVLAASAIFSGLAARPAVAAPLWGCHPDRTPNPCESTGSLDTTVLRSTTLQPRSVARIERTTPDPDRSIDCFYVYPTVVSLPRLTAPLALTSEVQAILKYQAARFSQACRVFAPIYRQATLAGIVQPVIADATGSGGAGEPTIAQTFSLGYSDVRAAWRDYLANENRGRGVILIGHSQGSGLLIRLLRDEIEPDPAQRAKIVSAIVPGANLVVPRGQRTGGDLATMPLCAQASETGCVLAWSTFATRPGRTALFGRAKSQLRTATGLPDVPNGEVACTNPAELAGDAGRLQSLSRSETFPGPIGAALGLLFYGLPPRASTPWVEPGERFRASCVNWAGAQVLRVRSASPTSVVPLEAPYPDWGLHLADLNLPLGNLITIVRAQRASWAATHPASAA